MSNIVYTDDLPEWIGGQCEYPMFPWQECVIKIKPKYKKDLGLLMHEVEHEEQWRERWFHSLRYKYDRSYRYQCELDAYTMQILEYDYVNMYQADWIVTALYEKYDLKMSEETITKDVRKLIYG